jgi:hypothetical protein
MTHGALFRRCGGNGYFLAPALPERKLTAPGPGVSIDSARAFRGGRQGAIYSMIPKSGVPVFGKDHAALIS